MLLRIDIIMSVAVAIVFMTPLILWQINREGWQREVQKNEVLIAQIRALEMLINEYDNSGKAKEWLDQQQALIFRLARNKRCVSE